MTQKLQELRQRVEELESAPLSTSAEAKYCFYETSSPSTPTDGRSFLHALAKALCLEAEQASKGENPSFVIGKKNHKEENLLPISEDIHFLEEMVQTIANEGKRILKKEERLNQKTLRFYKKQRLSLEEAKSNAEYEIAIDLTYTLSEFALNNIKTENTSQFYGDEKDVEDICYEIASELAKKVY